MMKRMAMDNMMMQMYMYMCMRRCALIDVLSQREALGCERRPYHPVCNGEASSSFPVFYYRKEAPPMSRCLIQTNRFSKRMRRSLHASPFAAQITK